jgi:hypothetical protein
MAFTYADAPIALIALGDGVSTYLTCAQAEWGPRLLRRVPPEVGKRYRSPVAVDTAVLMMTEYSIFPHIAAVSDNICSSYMPSGKVPQEGDLNADLHSAERAIELATLVQHQ